MATRTVGRLAGKVAVITGAGSGIGRAIAIEFAQEGAHVVVNDIKDEPAQEVIDYITKANVPGSASVYLCDVSDRAAVDAMMADTESKYGKIDIVVANAYYSYRAPFLEANWPDTLRTFEVTQHGVYHVLQLAAQRMCSKPLTDATPFRKLIVIGSVMADYPYIINTSTAYNMAKSATDALVGAIASSLGPHRINVNSIHPGWIDTAGERQFTNEDEMVEAGKHLPFGLGVPSDIAKGALYLASSDGDYVTGATLRIDGGFGSSQRIPSLHDPIQHAGRPNRPKL